MGRKHRFESPALQGLFDEVIGDDPERLARFDRDVLNLEVAQAIYDLRTAAGLTQAALAKRVGTTASVISRLEDADYYGHSLTMLRRIGVALDHRLEIRFVPRSTSRESRKKSTSSAPASKARLQRKTGTRAG